MHFLKILYTLPNNNYVNLNTLLSIKSILLFLIYLSYKKGLSNILKNFLM